MENSPPRKSYPHSESVNPTTHKSRIFSVQCNGVLSAGILCGAQFQFTISGSGVTSTNIAPQNNATVGIPYLGLASNTTANDPRCSGNGIPVPGGVATNTTNLGICAGVLGLSSPFPNFRDCELTLPHPKSTSP